MAEVCDLAEATIYDDLERQLLAVGQAAIMCGVAPPDIELAAEWLDEWLSAPPRNVDPRTAVLTRAVGLRR